MKASYRTGFGRLGVAQLPAATRSPPIRHATRHLATDYGCSDRRIVLQTLVIDWLAALR